MPPKYVIVIPLLHECSLLANAPVTFGAHGSARALSNEHLGCLVKNRTNISQLQKPNVKCLVMTEQDTVHSKAEIERFSLVSSFCLNIFSHAGHISFDRFYAIKKVKSYQLHSSGELTITSFPSREKYVLDKRKTPQDISALYDETIRALVAKPKLSLSIRRFNAAMARSGQEDKLIDMTICLESIFDQSSEISFRFSLYNAILAEPDAARREETFAVLRSLYTKRSELVHGSKEFDQNWFTQNWPRVVQIAKLALLNKIDFLKDNNATDWQAHLQKLALGVR